MTKAQAPGVWKRPTRRTFVAMLGAAAAAAAVALTSKRSDGRSPDPRAPATASARLPRWIGHV